MDLIIPLLVMNKACQKLATLYAQNEKPGLLEVFTNLENDAILLVF
jgi:hypothetical protein